VKDPTYGDLRKDVPPIAYAPATQIPSHEALWRQDDNGVRTLVRVFPGGADASEAMRTFEAARHKQVYWIERMQAKAAPEPTKPRGDNGGPV